MTLKQKNTLIAEIIALLEKSIVVDERDNKRRATRAINSAAKR